MKKKVVFLLILFSLINNAPAQTMDIDFDLEFDIIGVYLPVEYQFRFETINDDIFLTDHKNNRFKKILGDLYEYEYWSDIISNFIGTIVLDELTIHLLCSKTNSF